MFLYENIKFIYSSQREIFFQNIDYEYTSQKLKRWVLYSYCYSLIQILSLINTKLQNTSYFLEFLAVKRRESIVTFSEISFDTLNKSSNWRGLVHSFSQQTRCSFCFCLFVCFFPYFFFWGLFQEIILITTVLSFTNSLSRTSVYFSLKESNPTSHPANENRTSFAWLFLFRFGSENTSPLFSPCQPQRISKNKQTKFIQKSLKRRETWRRSSIWSPRKICYSLPGCSALVPSKILSSILYKLWLLYGVRLFQDLKFMHL